MMDGMKNVPELRFREFEGMWEQKRIGNYVKSSAFGPRFSSDLYTKNGNVGTLRTTDMDDDGNINLNQMPLANIDEDNLKDHFLLPNDIVISRSGTIGVTGIFRSYSIPVLPGAFLIRFRFNQEKLNPIFFQLFFNSTKGRRILNRLSAGGVQKNLKGTSILSLKLSLPSLPEQQKIATFLTAVDEKLQALKKKKELLELYKKGVMQKIFSQEVRFKDEGGREFGDWEEKKLEEICLKQSSNISANTLEGNTGEYKIYGASGFLKNVDFYREENEYISIVKDGAGVGRTLLCDAKSSVLGTLDIIKPRKAMNLFFIYILLQRTRFERYITGSTIPHIYFKDYSKEKIKVPCLSEQNKIAEFISSIDGNIEYLGEKILDIQSFKKGLLQKMFV